MSENSRTVAAAEALGKKDYGAAGRYMLESHASLREVSGDGLFLVRILISLCFCVPNKRSYQQQKKAAAVRIGGK